MGGCACGCDVQCVRSGGVVCLCVSSSLRLDLLGASRDTDRALGSSVIKAVVVVVWKTCTHSNEVHCGSRYSYSEGGNSNDGGCSK